jgi:hypothetical protein
MEPVYYIGLDVHKRKISYCVKDGSEIRERLRKMWEPRNQRRCLVITSDSYFSGYSPRGLPLGSSKEPLRALFSLP